MGFLASGSCSVGPAPTIVLSARPFTDDSSEADELRLDLPLLKPRLDCSVPAAMVVMAAAVVAVAAVVAGVAAALGPS